jgi:hypothetical protein
MMRLVSAQWATSLSRRSGVGLTYEASGATK